MKIMITTRRLGRNTAAGLAAAVTLAVTLLALASRLQFRDLGAISGARWSLRTVRSIRVTESARPAA